MLTHDFKVLDSSLSLNDELGDQIEVRNVVTDEVSHQLEIASGIM